MFVKESVFAMKPITLLNGRRVGLCKLLCPRLCCVTVLAFTITGSGAAIPAISATNVTGTEPGRTKTPESLLAAAKAAMPIDAAAAGNLAQAAEQSAMKLPTSQARSITVATARWLKAEALIRQNKAAAAVVFVDAALKSVTAMRPAIKLQGDLLQTRAGIEDSLGQPEAALEDYQRAYAIFGKTGPARSQAVALQNIGVLYLEANDLAKVFYYYRMAEETVSDDPMLNLSGSANKAGALFLAKRYREAEAEYRRAYTISVSLHNMIIQIQMLSNLARVQAILGELHLADITIAQAMKIWQPTKAPELKPVLLETRADLALDEDRSFEAVQLVEQALASLGAAAETRPYWQLQITAYKAYEQAGDSAKALAHFKVYNQLDNQNRALAASTSAALSAARFDFVNQNARIATLKAGQLQRDLELDRLQARQTMILLGGLLLLSIITVSVLAFYLRALRRSDTAIREINSQLTEVNIELNAALAAKTEFLATTSHEIRTPLNGILGMTQVLLADPELTSAVRERISLMQGAGETLRALVDDILDFAKMSDNKLELHPLEADLPKLLDDVVDFWRDRATQQKLFLAFDRAGVPERITIDSRRLRQILANLLSNAIKFTSEGSIKVTVTVAHRSNDACPVQSSERLRIAVTDTGIGIAESDHSAVFEKFRQLDSSKTRRFTGTGLGLSISRMIAQAMGGDIELVSTVEVGSTFTLDLPLVRAIVAAPSTSGERPSTLAAARLVLVGASPIAQGVLRAVLTPRVASFAVAADIPTAVDQITTQPVNIILVDVPAPPATEDPDGDLDAGIARLAATANLASRSGIVVAVLWPNQQPTEHARLVAAGVAAVIGKPITSNTLLQKLTVFFEEAGEENDRNNAAELRQLDAT